jgi:hypothetical protein
MTSPPGGEHIHILVEEVALDVLHEFLGILEVALPL